MLAVGDLRNRLMALADRSLHGNPQIYQLFAHRLPKDAEQAELAGEGERLIAALLLRKTGNLVVAGIVETDIFALTNSEAARGRKASILQIVLAAGG